MPTIIERIAAAEADAEALKHNAQETARMMTAAAEDDAAASLRIAREEAKAGLALAASMAEKEAEAEEKALFAKAGAEAEKLVGEARQNLPQAAGLILEHILSNI
ncbi:MAG: hypothetical protein J5586_08155 [Clostridia bacterium]|nr:hypothetical protein [Clostridia bacterium]